ncbi:replicative DNA helicase [Xanthomonas sacchari]|uniref:replicative DNA helicase n=1 Tax=Xanthomonas sacchari TaxID=56458 RepID=UPI0022595271|nr:replicative DNA helicase [Xanthomonas sacchari]MCW0413501.1 Replicative DNA helicase [Xanthomonas sacchari]UYK67796.1 replicative DNA helicase [Xanthomonas sacchari]
MSAVRQEIERMAALYGSHEAESVRVPPHSNDAEQAVLGGLMLSPEAWPLVSDVLAESQFYRRDHQAIFRAIRELAEKGRPFDAVTLGDTLESEGKLELVADGAYLIELASTTPSAANIAAYAEIVVEKSILRQLIEVGTETANMGFQPDGRSAADLLNEVSQRIGELQPAQRGGLQLAGDSMSSWYERFTAKYHGGTKMTGLPTPWKGFNEATNGLQPSTLYILAARPSMGKSVWGLNLAMFLALRGKTVGLFSLEMSRHECHDRNVAALARVPHSFVTTPTEAEDDGYMMRMVPAIRDLKQAPLYIDDTPSLSKRQFEARARRMHQRTPLEAIVIDHIHDFKIDAKMARFEYGAIVQTAKDLAKEWGIPVVALAQLNRNLTSRTERRPNLADLRESGELEQKGDVIAFLHREDYYDTPEQTTHLQGVVELHFAKGRNIKAGARVHLRNRFDQMRLDDWEGPLPVPQVSEKQVGSFFRKRKQQEEF